MWGSSFGDPEKLAQALVCFMRAVAIDPNFARAHAGIADYYLRLGLWGGLPPLESFAAALEYAQKAAALEPNLGEAHASLAFAIWAYTRDEAKAERHFTLATVRSPNYASAHHWFGLLNSARNRPEIAIANLERAQKVDPNSPVIAAALGFVYYNARDFSAALRRLLDASRELPKAGIIREMLTWCYLQTGNIDAALTTAQQAVELSQRGPAALAALAFAEEAAQHPAIAQQIHQELNKLAEQRYVSHYDRASVCLAAGLKEEALGHLEQAQSDRDWWTSWLGVDPRWDRLREHRRFQKLLDSSTKAGAKRMTTGALALLIFVVAALGIWWALHRTIAPPFANVKFTKLTSNGTAYSAVLSPDGRTVVYAAADAGGTSLWQRQMASGKLTVLVPQLSRKVSDLGFTNKGTAIQFVTSPLTDPSDRMLFTASVNGGSPMQMPGRFPGPVSLSPDGTRIATYVSNPEHGTDELWITEVTSGIHHLLSSIRYPYRFAWSCRPAWSPDGRQIAYAAEDRDRTGFLVRLYSIDAQTAATHLIQSPRLQWVESISWTADMANLAAVGQEQESSFQQIWYLPFTGGAERVRRIGNDLDDYFGAAVSVSGSEIVSVQSQTQSNVYLSQPGDFSKASQITVGSGRYFDLGWTRNGQILYASDATGSADLWAMKADGSGQHLIVSGTGRNYAPAASPSSDLVTFHSNRSGNWQVWQSKIDGSGPQRLSAGTDDGNWPQFTSDGKFVIFHRTGKQGVVNLWRVPSGGGPAVQITKALAMHPAVSAANGRIAAWYSESVDAPRWKIAVFSPDGGKPIKVFAPTADAKPDTTLRWTPDGGAIGFLDYAHSASNIWVQPMDGGQPRPLTSFDAGEIYSFDWSRGGKLIYSRGFTTTDVVLIRDLNKPEFKR